MNNLSHTFTMPDDFVTNPGILSGNFTGIPPTFAPLIQDVLNAYKFRDFVSVTYTRPHFVFIPTGIWSTVPFPITTMSTLYTRAVSELGLSLTQLKDSDIISVVEKCNAYIVEWDVIIQTYLLEMESRELGEYVNWFLFGMSIHDGVTTGSLWLTENPANVILKHPEPLEQMIVLSLPSQLIRKRANVIHNYGDRGMDVQLISVPPTRRRSYHALQPIELNNVRLDIAVDMIERHVVMALYMSSDDLVTYCSDKRIFSAFHDIAASIPHYHAFQSIEDLEIYQLCRLYSTWVGNASTFTNTATFLRRIVTVVSSLHHTKLAQCAQVLASCTYPQNHWRVFSLKDMRRYVISKLPWFNNLPQDIINIPKQGGHLWNQFQRELFESSESNVDFDTINVNLVVIETGELSVLPISEVTILTGSDVYTACPLKLSPRGDYVVTRYIAPNFETMFPLMWHITTNDVLMCAPFYVSTFNRRAPTEGDTDILESYFEYKTYRDFFQTHSQYQLGVDVTKLDDFSDDPDFGAIVQAVKSNVTSTLPIRAWRIWTVFQHVYSYVFGESVYQDDIDGVNQSFHYVGTSADDSKELFAIFMKKMRWSSSGVETYLGLRSAVQDDLSGRMSSIVMYDYFFVIGEDPELYVREVLDVISNLWMRTLDVLIVKVPVRIGALLNAISDYAGENNLAFDFFLSSLSGPYSMDSYLIITREQLVPQTPKNLFSYLEGPSYGMDWMSQGYELVTLQDIIRRPHNDIMGISYCELRVDKLYTTMCHLSDFSSYLRVSISDLPYGQRFFTCGKLSRTRLCLTSKLVGDRTFHRSQNMLATTTLRGGNLDGETILPGVGGPVMQRMCMSTMIRKMLLELFPASDYVLYDIGGRNGEMAASWPDNGNVILIDPQCRIPLDVAGPHLTIRQHAISPDDPAPEFGTDMGVVTLMHDVLFDMVGTRGEDQDLLVQRQEQMDILDNMLDLVEAGVIRVLFFSCYTSSLACAYADGPLQGYRIRTIDNNPAPPDYLATFGSYPLVATLLLDDITAMVAGKQDLVSFVLQPTSGAIVDTVTHEPTTISSNYNSYRSLYSAVKPLITVMNINDQRLFRIAESYAVG